MDISVRHLLSEKISNFYEVDPTLAAVLCAAGLASQIVKRAPAPPEQTETRWEVTRLPVSGKLAIQVRRPSGEVVGFTGAPAIYKAGLHYADSNCPLAVLAEYARRYGAPEVAGDYEAMMAAARSGR